MGLLTILKKVKQKERELRILILGLDNAGKTTGKDFVLYLHLIFVMKMLTHSVHFTHYLH